MKVIHRKISNVALFSPLYLWLIYSISTILVFEFGPLDFGIKNKTLLYGYLFFAHVAVIFGYYHGFKKMRGIRQAGFNSTLLNIKLLQRISFAILCLIAVSFLRDYVGGVSIEGTSQDAMSGKENYSKNRSGGLLGYLGAFLGVLVIPFLAAGIVCFNRLNKFSKYMLVLLIVRIIYDAYIGSSRAGLMMLIIVAFFSILVSIYSGQTKFNFKKLLIYFLPITFLFLAYSSYISVARQTVEIDDMAEYMSSNLRYDFDKDSLLIPKFEGEFKIINAGILTSYFYFGHAYAGLHDALELPFKGTTFFFGHSDFTIRNLARVFGDDVLEYSLHRRLVLENKSAGTLWVTAYTAIASDTTFIGSLAVLYFFGLTLSKNWIKSVFRPTLTSYALSAWMVYFFFQINMTFVPADLGAFISFWGAIFLGTFRFRKRTI